MYDNICRYAELYDLAVQKHRRRVNIDGYVMLDSNGNYVGFDDSAAEKGKIVPDIGTYAATEKRANFLCEKFDNIFNFESKKYASYIDTMHDCAETCSTAAVICSFLDKYVADEDFAAKVSADFSNHKLNAKSCISFKIDGECAEDCSSDWDNWLSNFVDSLSGDKAEADRIVSAVSGRIQKSVPAQAGPVIKNVDNDIKAAFGIGRPVYVAASKYDSYSSYGFDKALGMQVGEDDANLFAAGMEALLNSENNRNKDFSIVYFYSGEVENIIAESLSKGMDRDEIAEELSDEIEKLDEDNEEHNDLLSRILDAAKSGERINQSDLNQISSDLTFYMAQFRPQSGRCYMCNEVQGRYLELTENLLKWYKDTMLMNFDGRSKTAKTGCITKIYSVLVSCVSNQSLDLKKRYERVDKEFSDCKADLLQSVYSGRQINYLFYQRALRHAVNSLCVKGFVSNKTWLKIIKCYLIRKGLEIMPEMCEVNIAYACGQLFAVYEAMQYKASGKLNQNLAQSYFSAAMKQPAAIFAQLADLGTVYLNKMESGRSNYTMRLGELSEKIGTAFPKSFNEDEKGSFVLGYYQQRMETMKAAAEAKAAKTKADGNSEAEEVIE